MPTEISLFFDLDGTLTDPKPGITASIQYALQRLGRAVPSQDELVWCIGPTAAHEFCDAARRRGARRPRGGPLSRALCRYRTVREQRPPRYRVHAGCPGATRRADVRRNQQAAPLGEKDHHHFGLAGHFTHVFGSELDGTRVRKADLLAYALEQTGADPSRALMIGDRSHDVVGAKANGMDAVGVTYGYGSREELIAAGARHLCASPHAIVEVIHNSANAARC